MYFCNIPNSYSNYNKHDLYNEYLNYFYQRPNYHYTPYSSDSSYRQSLGVVWHEKEGSWNGEWRRRGDTNIFDAKWTSGGSMVTAILTVHLAGDFVTIQRRNSSDGNNCDYTGTFSHDGKTVSGTYICQGRQYHWNANIYHRDSDVPLGRYWDEHEGSWHGQWQRRGESNIFDARWTKGGSTVTAILEMHLVGNSIHIRRLSSSDGNNCVYQGSITGDGTVSGNYSCGGRTYSWNATIHY
ncbi:hypothetical protein [Paenibacillus eucommiae]|uniref:Uncharacterized protein n=1 Tax=Paenibacillus eucommiae TaxID=1355755 RepID=A0ABS4J085_9BACL|nr:hypothetical protein [Paenibacillus eucommiae]MBP1993252.1 hypothetical protein [Paenibacillus eucommiae]